MGAGFAADGTLQRFGRGEMEGHKHGKGDRKIAVYDLGGGT